MARRGNCRSQPPQPDPGLVHALGVAVPGWVLIGYDLMETSPCADLKCGLAARVGRDRDRGRSDGPGFLPRDERISALGLAGHGKPNRYLLGQRTGDLEQLCGITSFELQLHFADRR
jgi:hypothetical protein